MTVHHRGNPQQHEDDGFAGRRQHFDKILGRGARLWRDVRFHVFPHGHAAKCAPGNAIS